MRKTLDTAAGVIARMMALGFACLFVVTTSLALMLFNLERHLLNPETYKRALIQQRVYERLPALIANEIAAASRAGNYGWFNQAELQATLTAVLTPTWLQTQTESAIDQLDAYLTANGPPAVTVSLSEPRTRLAGQDGINLIVQVIRSWPPCSEADLLVWTAFLSNSSGTDLPLCSPPENVLSMAAPLLQEAASQMAYSLPAELTLNLASPADQTDLRPVIRLARMTAYASLCLPVICLIGIAMFGVRSVHDLLRWWGYPLSVAGLMGLVMAGLLILGMRWAVSAYITPLLANLPTSLIQIVLDTFGYVLREAVLWMGGEALVIGALGFTMVLGAFIFRPKRPAGRGSPA